LYHRVFEISGMNGVDKVLSGYHSLIVERLLFQQKFNSSSN